MWWPAMVPKIVAKGRSFKGAAAYLLHDKGGAETSDRVAWVETRNLATSSPEIGWRVMAATALDQDRLKEQAGIKKTGRKSDQAALHLVLSWAPGEETALSRDEMRRAAIGALKAIGADDRQALLIAHNDEDHAHLHVLCNRVSAADGRMLSSSKDRLKLSKWAQGYEMERGQVLCQNRVVNNERRAQGEFVAESGAQRYRKDGRSLTDAGRAYETVKAAQMQRDRQLLERGQVLSETHRDEWQTLEARYVAAKAVIKADAARKFGAAKREIGAAYHPLRLQQNADHAAERAAFEAREKSFFGRISNAWRAIDLGRCVRGDGAGETIGEGFRAAASAGARREAMLAAQTAAKDELNKRQAQEIEGRKAAIAKEARAERSDALADHAVCREALVAKHADETDALKAAWRKRTEDRAAAWRAYEAAQETKIDLRASFEAAADPPPQKKRQDDGGMDALMAELERIYGDEPDIANDNDAEHDAGYDPGNDFER
ncbi:relaxase/mobilization nuclease domain-containing protein [Acuticoccus yangtzensis]|uniref:relaxase/mobilization nuclease domain-containing protein n=1 Tax=Acuticoccus yangtzensis TaxID=1443441 RepID=UPI000D3E507C|nr:relaxase/mobilization nuclease domain-containing protein [Acuticoccus yangtzensis]